MIALFLKESQSLIAEGGWVFLGLLALSFGIAFALMSLWCSLQFPQAPVMSSREWRRLLDERCPSSELVARLRQSLNGRDLTGELEEIDGRLFAIADRRFPFAFVLIGAAPLVGLLGTVSGMFTTFDGMSGVAASAPVDTIAKGVSEALITTQAGLVIGVPSFIVCFLLKSHFDRLRLSFQGVVSALLQSDQ
ncbi:MAG: MotA/TolQ/ExbB proton channel family protein [Verrucomicrobiae bacterium]|nr:MotA/TolQ/ExbB proton channel family protein [Verrucomicrobiae bacterium]